jgi:hypothetical protein
MCVYFLLDFLYSIIIGERVISKKKGVAESKDILFLFYSILTYCGAIFSISKKYIQSFRHFVLKFFFI